jgi:hypothetical protein
MFCLFYGPEPFFRFGPESIPVYKFDRNPLMYMRRSFQLSACERKLFPATSKKRHRANPLHTTSPAARIENTCYSITPLIWCTTASSAHASYKGYGWNKTKPPQAPHRNTIINVGVLGCGPIWTGEGAAAPFNGVHIWEKFGRRGG